MQSITRVVSAVFRRTIQTKTHVENYVRAENTKVAPVVRVVDVEALLKERVRRAVRTVVARARVVLVREVPAGDLDKVAHVPRARLARGRLDGDELLGGAGDLAVADGLAEHRLDEVGERRQAVHPAPPTELTEGLQDTIAMGRMSTCHERKAEAALTMTARMRTGN